MKTTRTRSSLLNFALTTYDIKHYIKSQACFKIQCVTSKLQQGVER